MAEEEPAGYQIHFVAVIKVAGKEPLGMKARQ